MTEVTTRQKTSVASLIVVGVVGFGLAAAIFMFANKVQEPVVQPEPTGAKPLQLKDISTAVIQAGPDSGNSPQIWLRGDEGGLQSFGYFDSHYNYTDGSNSDMPLAAPQNVSIDIQVTPHKNLFITLKTSDVPSKTYAICIPELTADPIARVDDNAGILQRILGVQTAHAVVLDNTNDSNTNSSINTLTYYVDEQGNLYNDADLTIRVSTTLNCETVVARTFVPKTLTGITSAPDYDYGQGQWLYIYKYLIPSTDGTLLSAGAYSKQSGFLAIGEQLDGWRLAPAFFYHRRTAGAGTPGSPWAFPTTKVSVQSDLGTTVLCVPGKSLLDDEYQLYFYDKLGKPHSDIFLQKQVACGDTPNLCSTVKCSVTPTNPCCLNVKLPAAN